MSALGKGREAAGISIDADSRYIVRFTIRSSLTKYMKILMTIMSEPGVEILYTRVDKETT